MTLPTVSAAGGSDSTAQGVERGSFPHGIRLRSETLETGLLRHTVVVDGVATRCVAHFAEVKCGVVALAALWMKVAADYGVSDDALVTVGG